MKIVTKHVETVLTVTILLALFLLGSYVVQAEAQYEAGPAAEGQLSQLSAVTGMAFYPGDGVPLYPGDEKWETKVDTPNLAFNNVVSVTSIYAITASGSNVYVGGNFAMAGGKTVNNIARWDGTQWNALGTGVVGVVNAIAVDGSNVYVGGTFLQAGGKTVNYIARWDGTNWNAMGGGFSAPVNAIAVSGGNVYAGGNFTMAGNATASYIARWDGSLWRDMTGGVNGTVNAIAVSGSNVYVGGTFSHAGGKPANRVARYDGSQWSALGAAPNIGVNNGVNDVLVNGNDLIVGGYFTQAGGKAADGIARWDGAQWQAMGTASFVVYDLAAGSGGIYATGMIEHFPTGSYFANGVVRWDGSQWKNMGSGLTAKENGQSVAASGNAIDVSGYRAYVGGSFPYAGNKVADAFAIWHIQPTISISYGGIGAPGSIFTVIGKYFPANTTVTVAVNNSITGQSLATESATVTSDSAGNLTFNLSTNTQAMTGEYNVTVSTADGAASTEYQLDPDSQVRPPVNSTAPTVPVPAIVPPAGGQQLFMPCIQR